MKKNIGVLIALVAPTVLMGLLGYVTLSRNKPNGFVRNYKMDFATVTHQAQSKWPLYSICGITSNTIYFTTKEPGNLIAYSSDLDSITYLALKVRNNPRIRQFFKTTVDSPRATLYAGNVPTVLKTDLNKTSDTLYYNLGHTLFTDIVEYRKGRFIIRGYDPINKDFVFEKMDDQGKITMQEKNLSVATEAGSIVSQGTLLYHHKNGRLYYVYRLLNKIVCFDTSLNLVYKVNTIDTISTPALKFSSVPKNSKTFRTYGSPPLYTNYTATIAGDYLYINSLIKADNDKTALPVIDVYALKDGRYKYSFNLPRATGKLSSFLIKDHTLIALYKPLKSITTYHLR